MHMLEMIIAFSVGVLFGIAVTSAAFISVMNADRRKHE